MNALPGKTSQKADAVQRQIVLPMSKAAEIAWKSIRLRLSRSLLVTSGIVLALAFLMSIRVNDSMLSGMRDWASRAARPVGPAAGLPRLNSIESQFADERRRETEMRGQVLLDEKPIRDAIARGAAPPAGASPFDVKSNFGEDLSALQKELGTLPGSPAALAKALTAEPDLSAKFKRWIEDRRRLRAMQETLGAPQRLLATMKANGVPTTPAEIAAGRSQTRWLLGLALLVAFVGILNSMLMSVTERFREIGTMKCLGALDSFIIKLFLIESLFQGVVGTAAGITVGTLLSMASLSGTYHGYAWMNVPWRQVAGSALLSLVVGVGLTVAGAVYPAWQAARMQPIEAMRVEA